ncbi:hypothetical protein GN316_15625 [Xylophilus sp. Kf1]|nr:hypothetical protein [Xylophilus sp. Kf1]
MNAMIAQQGVEDATMRQIGLNNKKEAMNLAKIPSGAAVSASAEAARTVTQ